MVRKNLIHLYASDNKPNTVTTFSQNPKIKREQKELLGCVSIYSVFTPVRTLCFSVCVCVCVCATNRDVIVILVRIHPALQMVDPVPKWQVSVAPLGEEVLQSSVETVRVILVGQVLKEGQCHIFAVADDVDVAHVRTLGHHIPTQVSVENAPL